MMRGEIAFETSEAAGAIDDIDQSWAADERTTDIARAGRILTGICVFALLLDAVVPYAVTVFLLTATGAAAVVIGTRSPVVGLMGLCLLCAIDPAMRVAVFVPLGLPHNTLNHLLLLVALANAPAVVQRLDIRMFLLGALAVVMGLGVLHSADVRLGLQATLEVVVAFGIIGAFMRTDMSSELLTWLAVVVATACIACLGGYYYFPSRGVFINPNALVHVSLAAMACITLAVATSASGRWWVLTVLVTLNLALAFLTASRGGFIVSIPLVSYVLLRTPGMKLKGYSMAVVAVAFVILPMLWSTQISRTTAKWGRFVDPELSLEQATSRRVNIAELGWETFQEHPLGVGTGAFRDTRPGVAVREDVGLKAHSGWIRTMAENGVPGLFVLSGLVVAFVFARPRSPDIGAGLGPLVALTITLMLVTTEFQSKALWLLVGGSMVLLQGSMPAETPPPPRGDALRPSVINRHQRLRTW